jgi:hypothetical protein
MATVVFGPLDRQLKVNDLGSQWSGAATAEAAVVTAIRQLRVSKVLFMVLYQKSCFIGMLEFWQCSHSEVMAQLDTSGLLPQTLECGANFALLFLVNSL